MNKKIMVIVVIVECILAILLISVLGKAIETYYTEVECKEIYFTDEAGNRLEVNETTKMAIMEVGLTDTQRSVQLHWAMTPSDTSDNAVTFTSDNPEWVEVSETGLVNFFDNVPVVITVTAKNGKNASIQLVMKKDKESHVGQLD